MKTRLFRHAATAALLTVAQPALADPITYVVKDAVGSGSVVGQISTDGKIGTLATADFTAWTLALNGAGATYNLTNTNSSVVVQGGAVTASATDLSFNYAPGTASYLLFQNGLYSGNHYWCNANSLGACREGSTVAPNSAVSDPTAIFEARTGTHVLGRADGISVTTLAELIASLERLAISQRAQLITSNLFSAILLGKNEQVSCGDCGGVGASFGSFSLSGHGRKTITPELTALFGLGIGHYEEKGAFVTDSYTFAGGLRFDPANMGSSRPYVEIGGAIAPDQKVSYQRGYMTGAGGAIGTGATKTTNMSVYARAGWVARLTKRDELAGSISVGHSWQTQNAYREVQGAGNPFDGTFTRGVNQISMVGVGAQYSHLFGRRVEIAVDGSVIRSFGSTSSINAAITGVGTKPVGAGEITYFEPGARISYRVSSRVNVDAFINATIANQSIGTSKHGGFGVTMKF